MAVASTILRPVPCRSDRGALGGEIHRAEERADVVIRRQAVLQQGFGAADLALAGKEDEDAAAGLRGGTRDRDRPGPVRSAASRGRGRSSQRVSTGKAAALGGEDRRHHEFGHRGGVERGGHGEQDQVVAQRTGDLEAEREAEIGVERAFVEFVEDHRADAAQFRIGLDACG